MVSVSFVSKKEKQIVVMVDVIGNEREGCTSVVRSKVVLRMCQTISLVQYSTGCERDTDKLCLQAVSCIKIS